MVSQFVFGSMDEEKVKKPLLSSAMKMPPPLLAEAHQEVLRSKKKVQVASLVAALLFACLYAGFAAYGLCDPCQEPEPATWLNQRYEVTGADNVDATLALLRGLLWCSATQAATAALALALLTGSRSRRGLGARTAACVALAATAASHGIYLRVIGLIDSPPGDLLLALNTAVIAAAAVLDLLVFMMFVLGGDK